MLLFINEVVFCFVSSSATDSIWYHNVIIFLSDLKEGQTAVLLIYKITDNQQSITHLSL
jgi:hypothetical protein